MLQLYHDPCEFDRSLPPDIYIGTDYRCFNDHRLRKFFYNRESLVEKLKEQTLLTRENKVLIINGIIVKTSLLYLVLIKDLYNKRICIKTQSI